MTKPTILRYAVEELQTMQRIEEAAFEAWCENRTDEYKRQWHHTWRTMKAAEKSLNDFTALLLPLVDG